MEPPQTIEECPPQDGPRLLHERIPKGGEDEEDLRATVLCSRIRPESGIGVKGESSAVGDVWKSNLVDPARKVVSESHPCWGPGRALGIRRRLLSVVSEIRVSEEGREDNFAIVALSNCVLL